jgi:DNA polymerase-3 subunit gamma/tau
VSEEFPDDIDAASETASDGASDAATESASGGNAAAVAHASQHENPTDRAESLGTGLGDQATGDIVIDSALQDLQDAPQDDLDAQIDAGQRVQQTLQSRLSDLGGE